MSDPNPEPAKSVSARSGKKVFDALLILLAVAAGYVGVAMFDIEREKNFWGYNGARNRAELVALHDQLALGQRMEEVRNIMHRPQFAHLEFFRADDSTEWWILTPYEFGAKNWTLGLQFQDGRLTATQVRIEDSKDFRPKGAPADRGSWHQPAQ